MSKKLKLSVQSDVAEARLSTGPNVDKLLSSVNTVSPGKLLMNSPGINEASNSEKIEL
jgi:hypothetical protein